ncbi:alpha-ketoglutarate-dependent dioxygenase AlkB family protein [Roseitranquillus sediminis]|uniref:alpha-ketoglutarate-dependent dioxygenase AlkB family protein n=1 Tax=Roseitranquillus sediminis TaxID=2809051 RepID=UPI001D0C606A|nr:alpha-ketoglutarate-dependent dioxygenase AlkB [Roseitranquillus sediminis]MBM9593777.1 alpha-ketoglutarate-dependent dioxygenase AlkB [Roseitranquillus sediminis]
MIAPELSPTLTLNGVHVWKGWLTPDAQASMAADIAQVAEAAPPFRLTTRWGRQMSVEMTAAGRYGWFSDRRGYRYVDRHPQGTEWPPIPASVLAVWRELAGTERQPDCCLVNRYREGARMGLHQDRDESDFTQPVLSISLGDDALFRVGGTERGDPTRSVWIGSGDVLRIAGAARLAFHGVDRTRFGSSSLLPGGGRINLTLRVVD